MVTYRLAIENDYKNINDFYNRLYSKNRTLEQFYWEFHNCPFGKSVYVIAEDEQKIVGTNCVIPMQLVNHKNEITLTGKSEDTLVDPDYRGQNIFYNIYEFLFEKCKEHGIKVIWGYTSALKPFKKLGFSVPFEHEQSLIVHDVWKSYAYLSALNSKNTAKLKLKIFGLCLLSKLRSVASYLSRAKSAYRISDEVAITEQVDSLLDRSTAGSADAYYILQNKAFQQWRIYKNPNYFKVHTFGFYDKQNTLMALVVIHAHDNGIAYMVQSSFDNVLTEKEKTVMLKAAVQRTFAMGVGLIRNWHFNTNKTNRSEIEVFKNASFFHLKKGIGFVWKEIKATNLNPNNFYLSRTSAQGTS